MIGGGFGDLESNWLKLVSSEFATQHHITGNNASIIEAALDLKSDNLDESSQNYRALEQKYTDTDRGSRYDYKEGKDVLKAVKKFQAVSKELLRRAESIYGIDSDSNPYGTLTSPNNKNISKIMFKHIKIVKYEKSILNFAARNESFYKYALDPINFRSVLGLGSETTSAPA